MSDKDVGNLGSTDKVFHMPANEIEKYYMQYIDSVVEYSTHEDVARMIIDGMDNLRKRHQWVPTSWVY